MSTTKKKAPAKKSPDVTISVFKSNLIVNTYELFILNSVKGVIFQTDIIPSQFDFLNEYGFITEFEKDMKDVLISEINNADLSANEETSKYFILK